MKMERSEVIKILKLVADGKATPEQGADLLEEFLGGYSEENQGNMLGKKVRIQVYNKLKEAQEVNINVPMKLAGFITKFLKGKTSVVTIGEEKVDIDVGEILDEIGRTNEPIEIETEEHIINVKVDS